MEKNYNSLIKDCGTIHLRSVFDFTGGAEDIFSFIYECRKRKCDVVFVNENIKVKHCEDYNEKIKTDIILSIYAALAKGDSEITEAVHRYFFCLENIYEEKRRVPTRIDPEK